MSPDTYTVAGLISSVLVNENCPFFTDKTCSLSAFQVKIALDAPAQKSTFLPFVASNPGYSLTTHATSAGFVSSYSDKLFAHRNDCCAR
jgi:hypothetical protein